MSMHPHQLEEIALWDFINEGPAYADRREAELGAEWINNWQDEYLLTDRDVWITNPHYAGPQGMHPEFMDHHDPEPEDLESERLYKAELDRYYDDMQGYFYHSQMLDNQA